MAMKSVHVRLQDWVYERLKAKADRSGMQVAVMVRHLLAESLAGEENATPPAGPSNPSKHGKL